MIIIGIDPGLDGAVAILNTDGDVLEVHDMPTLELTRGGKAKREVSAIMLSNLISGTGVVGFAVLERVGAMPGQGVTSVFSFGRSVGVIEGVLAAYDIPINIVTPQAWQKAAAMRGGKDGSRARAMEVFPAYADQFKLKKHDGRADAALMAKFGGRGAA